MGKRSNFPRRDRDFYPTPPEAVQPLLPHLPYGTAFVEPCAGNMALVNALEAEGMSCLHALDIEPRHHDVSQCDALSDDLDLWCDSAEFIITNPPWSRDLLHPMIRHFSARLPTWLLFDADWVHTRQAAPFMPLLRAIVSVGRVKWIAGSEMTGKDNCAWYLFNREGDQATLFHGRVAA